MNVCEDHDGVLVYEGRKCPWCEEVKSRGILEREYERVLSELLAEQRYAEQLQARCAALEKLAPEAMVVLDLQENERAA